MSLRQGDHLDESHQCNPLSWTLIPALKTSQALGKPGYLPSGTGFIPRLSKAAALQPAEGYPSCTREHSQASDPRQAGTHLGTRVSLLWQGINISRDMTQTAVSSKVPVVLPSRKARGQAMQQRKDPATCSQSSHQLPAQNSTSPQSCQVLGANGHWRHINT